MREKGSEKERVGEQESKKETECAESVREKERAIDRAGEGEQERAGERESEEKSRRVRESKG